MATDFTGTAPITGGGQVFVRNANGEWEIANVTAPGVVLTVLTVGSGTFTAPPGSVLHKVIASGSGGGGGGADSDGSGNTGGGGGQGGGTCIKFYTSAAMGATASYTVGAGGAGGANTGGTGTAGADTTFNPAGTGATLTGAGGSGGEGNSITGTYSAAISGGGAAGTATNGDVNIVGGSGGYGAGLVEALVENNAAGGHGGASYWGGGGLGGAANGSDTDPGGNGKAYGSGGGGAACGETTSGVAGGDGEDGIIVIESYIRQSVLSPIVYDANGNELLDLSNTTASAINQLAVYNAATGNRPSIAAVGDDTNVSISLVPKGSGDVYIESATYAGVGLRVSTEQTALGDISWIGRNSAAEDIPFCYIYCEADSTTDGAEHGEMQLIVLANGAENAHYFDGLTTSFYSNTSGWDLGRTTKQWNDLYLGGSVYLGGTAAANALDDYEEGTWTPDIETTGTDFTSVTYSDQYGYYTKIGEFVYFTCTLNGNGLTRGSASGDLQIAGLPFTVKSGSWRYNAFSIGYVDQFATIYPSHGISYDGQNIITLAYNSLSAVTDLTLSQSNWQSGTSIRLSGSFQAA